MTPMTPGIDAPPLVGHIRRLVRQLGLSLLETQLFPIIIVLGGIAWGLFDLIIEYLRAAEKNGKGDDAATAVIELTSMIDAETRRLAQELCDARHDDRRPSQPPSSGQAN